MTFAPFDKDKDKDNDIDNWHEWQTQMNFSQVWVKVDNLAMWDLTGAQLGISHTCVSVFVL